MTSNESWIRKLVIKMKHFRELVEKLYLDKLLQLSGILFLSARTHIETIIVTFFSVCQYDISAGV